MSKLPRIIGFVALSAALLAVEGGAVAGPITWERALPPSGGALLVKQSAFDHWLALVKVCREAKFPDCPKGCKKDAKRERCYPPTPPGTLLKSLPSATDICEGYYPDCPDFCQRNDALKKCEFKEP